MRPCTPLLLCLALGCALRETPTDSASESGAGDNAEVLPAAAPASAMQNGDDVATLPADGVDASMDASPAPSAGGGANDADEVGDPGTIPSFPPFDPGEGGVCTGPLAPGDIVIDELMIESVAGSGDHGEWLEVESTVGCAIDIRGLHGGAPSGSKVRRFDVSEDVWIPALGRFVVADSNIAAINHNLPGTVVTWFGQPGDVLRNKGGTVTLHMNGVLIDSVTYPSMTLTVGASLAFPSDCAPSRRTDWAAWQTSIASWFPGFYGTPNSPNTDVTCP